MINDDNINHLGITGSRNGCTLVQYENIMMFLSEEKSKYHTLNTGCCLGVDELVSVLAHFTFSIKINAFPPLNEQFISRLTLDIADDVREPDEYLTRNRNIVLNSELMLCVPRRFHPDGSGTWYTMQYATSCKTKMRIFWPTGEISEGL